jgi:hypothetical protein
MRSRAGDDGSVAVVQSPRSRPISSPSLIAALIAFADDALYILLIRSQGNAQDARVMFVAVFIASEAVVALGAALVDTPAVRTVLLGAASGGLLALGLLGLFSIGLPLVVAGLLTTVAWTRSIGPGQPSPVKPLSFAVALVAVMVLAVGIGLT